MKHFKPLLSFWSRFVVSPPRFRPVFLTLLILIVLFANTLVFVRGVSAEKGYFPFKVFSTLLNGFDKEKDPDNPQIAGLALSSNVKPKSASAKQLPESNQSSDVVLGDSIQKIAPGSSSSNITLQNVTTNGASTSQNLSLLGKVYFGSGIEVKGSAKFQKSADVEGNLTVGTKALHVDTTNDQVGIGTVHPQHKLDVAGNVKVGQELIVYQETTLKDKLQVQGETELTGILNANGGIEIDNDKLIIDGKRGDVETGGTMRVHDQAWLNSNVSLGNDSSDTLETNARVGSHFIPKTTNTYDLGSSSLYWNNIYARNLFTSGTITASGNILPGATDSYDLGSASARWNNVYAKNINSSGTTTSSGSIIPGADNTYSLGSSLYRWKDLYLGPASIKIYNSIGTNAEYMTLGYSSNVATLDVKRDGSGTYRPFAINQNGSEAMRITGGNVGIGTDNPLYKLDVNGDGRIQGGELYLSGVDSSPSTTEGTMYYDSDDDQLKVYGNGKWQSDRSTATIIVAASDSRNKEKADYICDGTDDQVEIQAAINALPSTGGLIQFLDGTYNIKQAVVSYGISTNKSFITFRGMGASTIIKAVENTSIFSLAGGTGGGWYYPNAQSSIVFENIKFVSWTANNAMAINTAGNIMALTIRNCYFYNFLNAINFTSQSYAVKIHDNHFENNTNSIRVAGGACHDFLITNNKEQGAENVGVNSTVRHFILGDEVAGSQMFEWTITGNSIEHIYDSGLQSAVIYIGFSVAMADMVIANNTIEECNYGVYALLGSGYVNFFNITGNSFRDINKTSLFISFGDNANGYSNIVGNSFFVYVPGGAAYKGIEINNDPSGAVAIKNNLFIGYTKSLILTLSGTTPTTVPKVSYNSGYTTENSGTATITSGNTSTTVSHGLDIEPATSTIAVVPTNNLGSATKFWVSNVATTTFQINTDIDPGAATATFSWQIGSY